MFLRALLALTFRSKNVQWIKALLPPKENEAEGAAAEADAAGESESVSAE